MGKNKHKKHHKRDSDDVSEIRGAKGLKLILKVGGGGSTPETLEAVSHKKKKKKKDKKRRHHHRDKARSKEEDGGPEEEDGLPEEEDEEEGEVSSSLGGGGPSSLESRSPLSRLLEHLLPALQKRDVDNFFGIPVTDAFAPGYSNIIKEPMDFSTMREKLSSAEYESLETFKSDFELMCRNAMVYNTQGTVYYKAAKKLLALGQRLFTPERLRPLREHLSFMNELGPKELGFELEGPMEPIEDLEGEEEGSPSDAKKPRLESDDLSPEEILAFARQKAAQAAEKAKKKKTQLGFLRQNPDGTTSLSFLTGSDGVIPGTKNERPVLLGSLIGKVKQGTGAIQGYKEDRNNVAKAVYPLYYGAFSSHGPSYDSTFANLTQEETELVYSTYGDDVGVKYAESIMNFGRDCDYAMFIVDHLLDILTGNEHRKTSKYIEEQKTLRKERDLLSKAMSSMDSSNEESLKTLEKEAGLDMSLLDHLKKEDGGIKKEEKSSGPSQEEEEDLLKKNAELIRELAE
ncbi:Uncharacterized protein FKW44_023493, partial [Caligus rogercresseyi]